MRAENENLSCTASQVLLVGSTHVHTQINSNVRSVSHSSGCLTRISLKADSNGLSGNGLPHRGQRCGSCTPARVDLGGGPPDRLEPGCGSNSSAPSINSYGIVDLILARCVLDLLDMRAMKLPLWTRLVAWFFGHCEEPVFPMWHRLKQRGFYCPLPRGHKGPHFISISDEDIAKHEHYVASGFGRRHMFR